MRNRYKPLKTFEFEIDKCLLTGLEVYHRRKMKLYISLLYLPARVIYYSPLSL